MTGNVVIKFHSEKEKSEDACFLFEEKDTTVTNAEARNLFQYNFALQREIRKKVKEVVNTHKVQDGESQKATIAIENLPVKIQVTISYFHGKIMAVIEKSILQEIFNRQSREAKSKFEKEKDIIPKMRVLIVDDDPWVRKVNRLILEKLGFTSDNIIEAADGGPALDVFNKASEEQKPFDCVITDNSMEEMPGYQLITEIRKKDNKTPIIVVSSDNSGKDIIRFKEAGASGFISKSMIDISPKDLEKTIDLARIALVSHLFPLKEKKE